LLILKFVKLIEIHANSPEYHINLKKNTPMAATLKKEAPHQKWQEQDPFKHLYKKKIAGPPGERTRKSHN
jgi:hypothetical protein